MDLTSGENPEQTQDDLVLLHQDHPKLNQKQLLEAKENLDRYFDLAVRIFLRLENEQQQSAFDTTKETS